MLRPCRHCAYQEERIRIACGLARDALKSERALQLQVRELEQQVAAANAELAELARRLDSEKQGRRRASRSQSACAP